jgi:hypothetical protein
MSESPGDILKAQRHSARAIPVYAALLVASALLLWLAGRFVTVPVWLTATVIGVTAFTLVADIVNVVCCEWRLRRRGPSNEAIQRTRSAGR